MKRGLFLIYLLVLIMPLGAASIDPAVKQMTHYAEEYETGNINYAQLIVYISSLQGELAEEMGALAQGHDAVLSEQQLKSALGEPTESTSWVWVEGEEREEKVDNEVSAWRRIIFDGKEIQIWLNAWPSLIIRDGEETLIYRLHNDMQLKEPEEDLDIENELNALKQLAEEYSSSWSNDALERLAEESVNVEQLFNSHFNQNPGQCREVMNNLLGSENKRDSQKILVEEITLFEGERTEAIMRVEMCDDCNWHWIGLNMWVESRGAFNGQRQENEIPDGRYKGMSSEQYKEQTRTMIHEIRGLMESGDFEGAQRRANELRMLTDAWNEVANNVWDQFNGPEYQVDFSTMTPEQQEDCARSYCWLKKNQERAQAQKSLIIANYEERKAFYLELFAPYEKKEQYFTQEQWEKMLVQSFVESGKETCNDNVDNNGDGAIDCAEAQCGGQVCGVTTVTRQDENNVAVQEDIQLYCIQNTCQQREEIILDQGPICGNNICEEGEAGIGVGSDVVGEREEGNSEGALGETSESVEAREATEAGALCLMDCVQCTAFEPLACEGGSVVFSGNDVDGCPLAPVCVQEVSTCTLDSDCAQPLCGTTTCIEGTCQIAAIEECREAECLVGEERVQSCVNGDSITSAICNEGIWVETGVGCAEGSVGEDVVEEIDEIVGFACVVRSDCGGENDVCSNGQCVTLPDVVTEPGIGEEIIDETQEETPEIIEEEEGVEESGEEETPAETSEITGNVIFSFFRTFTDKLITARAVEGEGSDGSGGGESDSGAGDSSSSGDSSEGTGEGSGSGDSGAGFDQGTSGESFDQDQQFDDQREREEEEREERQREDQERRENECRERCDRECYDMKVRPAVEKCIFETCGEENFDECDLDATRVSCETSAVGAGELESCTNDCFDKCTAGEETWREPEREEKRMEKFVFSAGGACREEKGRENGNLWFNAWGQELQDFHQVKNKYYSWDGGGDWCRRELNNLLRQRQELENSLDEEFAAWFFGDYVANAADDWQNQMSGIFDLYWSDVELSKQIAERQRCLGQSGAPSDNLINFKYETDYGSVEFWEEIKSANLGEAGEAELISPYMRIWLFPSRTFFVNEMQRAMEQHRMPGPAEEQGDKKGGLSAQEKEELRSDEEFMGFIREFNANHGDSLAIQFKNPGTGEIIFNIYVKVNEQDLIYFEPMLVEEMPQVDVTVTLDSEKLLDIIEYGESGRVELQSPPWDRKPEVGGLKGVVSGAQMYLKMRTLMGSIEVSPATAEKDAKEFMREFFDMAMGDDREGSEGQNEKQRGKEGPEGFDEGDLEDLSDDPR